jgi:hypothetical protein
LSFPIAVTLLLGVALSGCSTLAFWRDKEEPQAPVTAKEATWRSTSVLGAPTRRSNHVAVWTGKQMIVWGGHDGRDALRTGAAYDPAQDTWRAMNTVQAPNRRELHTAVWTGTHMIVWGGQDQDGAMSSGAIYDPATNTWTPLPDADAPTARSGHTAVWTGAEMIVWGGYDGRDAVSTGGIYDPAKRTWRPMSRMRAPEGRDSHSAVWTGKKMVVWGGTGATGPLDTGGLYDPKTNTWTAMRQAGAPAPRQLHSAVWTGDRMIVWGGSGKGGFLSSGAAQRTAWPHRGVERSTHDRLGRSRPGRFHQHRRPLRPRRRSVGYARHRRRPRGAGRASGRLGRDRDDRVGRLRQGREQLAHQQRRHPDAMSGDVPSRVARPKFLPLKKGGQEGFFEMDQSNKSPRSPFFKGERA